jgi:hypothetical protein
MKISEDVDYRLLGLGSTGVLGILPAASGWQTNPCQLPYSLQAGARVYTKIKGIGLYMCSHFPTAFCGVKSVSIKMQCSWQCSAVHCMPYTALYLNFRIHPCAGLQGLSDFLPAASSWHCMAWHASWHCRAQPYRLPHLKHSERNKRNIVSVSTTISFRMLYWK